MRNRYTGTKTQPHGFLFELSEIPDGCLNASECPNCLSFHYCQSVNSHIDVSDWYLLSQVELFHLINSKNHE